MHSQLNTESPQQLNNSALCAKTTIIPHDLHSRPKTSIIILHPIVQEQCSIDDIFLGHSYSIKIHHKILCTYVKRRVIPVWEMLGATPQQNRNTWTHTRSPFFRQLVKSLESHGGTDRWAGPARATEIQQRQSPTHLGVGMGKKTRPGNEFGRARRISNKGTGPGEAAGEGT